jgi:hypothetical protein
VAALLDSRVQGNVYLAAPSGAINAGDAGIVSAGDLTLAAVEVVNADNIDVGGASVGVPSGDSGGLSVNLGGVSSVTNNNDSKDPTNQLPATTAGNGENAPVAIVTGEFLGIIEDEDKEDSES